MVRTLGEREACFTESLVRQCGVVTTRGCLYLRQELALRLVGCVIRFVTGGR